MNTFAKRLLAIAIIPVCLAGCFDRDREMINRKSDGTDTFKFKVPPKRTDQSPNKKSEQAPPKSKSETVDDIETFKFDKNAKYLPKSK